MTGLHSDIAYIIDYQMRRLDQMCEITATYQAKNGFIIHELDLDLYIETSADNRHIPPIVGVKVILNPQINDVCKQIYDYCVTRYNIAVDFQ